MNGKGDKSRINDIKRYKENYDRIFNSNPSKDKSDRKPRQAVRTSNMERNKGSNSKRV